MPARHKETDAEIERDFHALVNMHPAEIADWLETEESRPAGFHNEGEPESIGHQSGRRIIAILRKRAPDLNDEDRAHMRKVVAYIKRHLAQRPGHAIEHTRWRDSLLNWGHDPLKD